MAWLRSRGVAPRMEDRGAKGPRKGGMRSRMRDALAQAGRRGAASLAGVRRTLEEAGDRLKHSQAAEKVGAAVEARLAVKRAADASQRGDHAAAYQMLAPEAAARPDDARVVVAFWQAALACERAADAAPALQQLIRSLVASGHTDRAAELWAELHGAVPRASVDPGSLVRIALSFQAQGAQELFGEALRQAVDPANGALTPGLAMRITELARESDLHTAVAAARCALGSPDLDSSKRARLVLLVSKLERAESTQVEQVATAREAGQDEVAPSVAGVLAVLAPAARFAELKLTEAMPTRLRDEGLSLLLPGGRKARIEYAKIEALAVAEVSDVAAHPVWLIDLALNWNTSEESALRVIRLRSDGFDARMLVEASADEADALRRFLGEIASRSGAAMLPDTASASGAQVRQFDCPEAYQREVLQVGSE